MLGFSTLHRNILDTVEATTPSSFWTLMASTLKSFTGIYSIPPDEETLPKIGKGQLSPSPWILEVPCKTLLIPPCDRNQIITASGTSLKWGSPVRTLEDLLLAVARTKASARPKSCLGFFSLEFSSLASVASIIMICRCYELIYMD